MLGFEPKTYLFQSECTTYYTTAPFLLCDIPSHFLTMNVSNGALSPLSRYNYTAYHDDLVSVRWREIWKSPKRSV